MKQVPAAAVPIFPALGKEGFKVPRRCGVQCCSLSVWRSVELEPLRYAATFIAGPSGNFAVGQTLFAQCVEHSENPLTRSSMREAGTPAMSGSVNNSVLRQDGSAGGTSRKAHLFFDCQAKVLDQMKPIGYLPGLGAPSRTACAYRPQRSRLTISMEGWFRSHWRYSRRYGRPGYRQPSGDRDQP